jgi:bifunctional non-homologous end joining protein LigD
MNDRLDLYNRKRRFDATPEPAGTATRKKAGRKRAASDSEQALSYVIQEHAARHLHYDFRLELNGTLLSWAVPKGPSLDPSVKRLAVHVEDHPLDYGSFEGEIPPGNYGAGTVIVWDRGTWEPAGGAAEAARSYKAGKLKFELFGEKLHGGWTLVRSHMRGSGDKEQWLLIKERDDAAREASQYDVLKKHPGSVLERSAPVIEGALKAALPATFKPQLATLVDTAPPGDDWAYEIKFDGYRVLIRIDRKPRKTKAGTVTIFTRAGNDWTAKFGKQVEAFERLGTGSTGSTASIESAWLDGEAVVLAENGVPDFQALQNAFDANRPQDIVIYLFDIPFLNGYDLRGVPLDQRRAILRALMDEYDATGKSHGEGMLRFSNDFAFSADDLLKSACGIALEGIIGKRRDSGYTSGRSSAWIKLKCRRRQEFVIGGYSEPAGSRAAFGALLLGVYDEKGKLHYAGRVGTGFDASLLRSLKQQLDDHASRSMPFDSAPRERSRTPVHWVEPVLVCECNFAEWTSDGIVRQASFVSLRDDKPARQIVKEAPHQGADVQQPTDSASASGSVPKKRVAKTAAASGAAGPAKKATATNTAKTTAKTTATKSKAAATPAEVAGVRISHPERIVDKSTGTRKIDLVHYYESVADWMLPHLQARPVSLVRAPEDIGAELFFQKHSQKLSIPNVTQHAGLDPGHPPLITVDTLKALVGAAQMGTIEFHTWNAVVSKIEKPDRMVFDLDPDASLGWERMIEAAQVTRALLEELGLTSFCKTSGGKGFHVVVPLAKQAGWDEVKAFSQAVAQHMAATLPKYFSAKMGAQNRKKKIFVDYLRNNRGSSTVAAFSARARPGLGVSVPLSWDEVATTTSGDQWTVENVHERLADLKRDPWADYAKTRQRITVAMKKRLDDAA